jgi:ADP-ribose pyrophosphatase YjhB (NUDIX family)
MKAQPRAPSIGVGAVVVEDRKLLVVKRGREPNRGLWAIPGGKVGWGETLVSAVRREVAEETGLLVEVGEVVWAGEAMASGVDPAYHYALVDFEARVVGGSLRAGDDADEAAFVDLAEARSLPLTPTMFDLLDLLEERFGDSRRTADVRGRPPEIPPAEG